MHVLNVLHFSNLTKQSQPFTAQLVFYNISTYCIYFQSVTCYFFWFVGSWKGLWNRLLMFYLMTQTLRYYSNGTTSEQGWWDCGEKE